MRAVLSETNAVSRVESDYFVRMMLPAAEKQAASYVREEKRQILRLLGARKYLSHNFVVVGAGTLWYIDDVYDKVRKYIAVEPLAEIFIQKQVRFLIRQLPKIHVIGKEFGRFPKRELGTANSLFIFHFNILSYIEDPIKQINKYLRAGDVLYLSTWADTEQARRTRKAYFDVINIGHDSEGKIDPGSGVGLCNLDDFDFSSLAAYKRHERRKGQIADILIIYA